MNHVLYSLALQGLDAELIKVEVDQCQGHPGTVIVGLGDAAVQESRERVRSAMKNSSLKYPRGKVVVNLAPADIKKVGPCFDLPIALGIAGLSKPFTFAGLDQSVFLGELSLDGSLRPIQGVLALAGECKERGFKYLFVPEENAQEAALIEDLHVVSIAHLQQALEILYSRRLPDPVKRKDFSQGQGLEPYVDFADVKGQMQAKRALEIAASGGHNIVLNGSPGSGKSMMARALSGILPPLSPLESLEVTKIWSLAGLLDKESPIISNRPFRTVHHTASGAALVGGGSIPRPGEISLAHRGVLFLDEMAEFPKRTLELLRQPLEDHQITISRAQRSLTYPAQFFLCGAMNPCPCGYSGVPGVEAKCECSPFMIESYQKKLSGPLLDRIDMMCSVSPVDFDELHKKSNAEPSSSIRVRVEKARMIQSERLKSEGLFTNSEMRSSQILKWCQYDDDVKQVLEKVVSRLQLSARSFHRMLKVSRTIADLDASEKIQRNHVLEALQYRRV